MHEALDPGGGRRLAQLQRPGLVDQLVHRLAVLGLLKHAGEVEHDVDAMQRRSEGRVRGQIEDFGFAAVVPDGVGLVRIEHRGRHVAAVVANSAPPMKPAAPVTSSRLPASA
jgi:hypothetical protein